MKAHSLLLQRHAGGFEVCRHDGCIAADQSNLRWRSDGIESGRDREAICFVATTDCIRGEDVRDLMTVAVKTRSGAIDRLLGVIEWVTDYGSGSIAGETRPFAEIGFEPLTTPVQSPQCNGMAEAFVLTIKRDHARVIPMPTAEIVMRQLPKRFDYYNELHPPRCWQTVLRESPSQTVKPRRRVRSLRDNYSDAEHGSARVPPIDHHY